MTVKIPYLEYNAPDHDIITLRYIKGYINFKKDIIDMGSMHFKLNNIEVESFLIMSYPELINKGHLVITANLGRKLWNDLIKKGCFVKTPNGEKFSLKNKS